MIENELQDDLLSKSKRSETKKRQTALIISACSALIALGVFALNMFIYNDLNEKWSKINEADVSLMAALFSPVKEYEWESIPKNFGYDDPLINTGSFLLGNGKCQQYAFLIAYSDSLFQKKLGVNRAYTLEEMVTILRKSGLPSRHLFLSKMLTLQFYFVNNGNINAKNFAYSIKVKDSQGNWQPVGKENDTVKTFIHDSQIVVSAYPHFPINLHFPDSLDFEIACSFCDSHNNRKQKSWSQTWKRINFSFSDR